MKIKLIAITALLATGMLWNSPTASAELTPDDAAKLQAQIGDLYQRAKKQPGDKTTRLELNTSILTSGEELRKKYVDALPPAALSRYLLLRRVMMTAAERVYQDAPTAENRANLCSLAKAVLALPVHDPAMWVGVRGFSPATEVVHAGRVLALMNIYDSPGAAPKEAAKEIRAMLALFPDNPAIKGSSDFHKQATVAALQLATQSGEKDLTKELAGIVTEKCLDTTDALDALMAAGQAATFAGELTTLDGKKLTFPQDAAGKVVLVDFWATWCGPCRAAMPHLKELHEKYKDRGVWIVGVSCDAPLGDENAQQNRQKVTDFLTNNGCVWTQTYSGQWPAIAAKYGICKFPTVFVVNQQGKIISASARGQEEKLINQALDKKS